MYVLVTSTSSVLFDTLEANHVLDLDPLNEVDLFYLHCVTRYQLQPINSPIQL